jgi:acyl carrier protein
MPEVLGTTDTIFNLLWQSLEGGTYNIPQLKQDLQADSLFEDFGFDSLDLVDFTLRVQERFRISLRQEDLPTLVSVEAVEAYIRAHEHAA